ARPGMAPPSPDRSVRPSLASPPTPALESPSLFIGGYIRSPGRPARVDLIITHAGTNSARWPPPAAGRTRSRRPWRRHGCSAPASWTGTRWRPSSPRRSSPAPTPSRARAASAASGSSTSPQVRTCHTVRPFSSTWPSAGIVTRRLALHAAMPFSVVKERLDFLDADGCECRSTLLEGGHVGTVIETATSCIKVEPAAGGGSVVKVESTYKLLPGVEEAQYEVAKAKESVTAIFKAAEAYLIANPDAYN
uniref:Bet v I/Major latex protein domain-containing protein n=1 Tax=Aegilops tauschii subsp. strangulata TaxID=200361 RepID=A0A453CRB7_AEGTS